MTALGACILSALVCIIYPILGKHLLLALKLVYFTIPFFGGVGMLTRLREDERLKFSTTFLGTYALLFAVFRCVL